MFNKKVLTTGVLLLCFLIFPWHARTAADEATFPQFDCVTPNVNFWIDIYATYTTSQAVVHDSVDLNIIYDVIEIRPYEEPGSREINRKLMEQAKTKYGAVLKKLAGGPAPPEDAEAKRVATLFGEPSDLDTYRRAAENIRCQIGQKDRFLAGLIRSGAYLQKIREILRSYDLPEDLAYLPHVESSFNVKAYSKFGAAGLWQFMRSTGQRFMEVGYVLDERRDPIQATHAAAKLLKENYQKLGNWPMALTAYNHGAAGMENAKRLHGTYPQIFKHHQSRLFKFASRNFYSEFLAARHVARNYRDYFGEVVLDTPRLIQTVTLEGYCSFEKLRNHFGLDAAELMELNPALRPPVYSGQKLIPKGYVLNLPEHAPDRRTPLIAAIPSSLYQGAQMPSLFYTVQAGDTASKIAKKHGVPLPTLLAANNISPRSILQPRQTLRIPGAGEALASGGTPGEILLAVKTEKTVEQKVPQVAPAESSSPPAPVEKADWMQMPPPTESKPASAPVELAAANLQMMESAPSTAGEASESPPVPAEVKSAPTEPSPEPSQPHDQTYPQPILAALIPIAAETSPVDDHLPVADPRPNFEIVAADMKIEELGKLNGIQLGQIHLEIEETLGHIAEWAKVRTQKVRDLNNLRFATAVQLGQKLKIPLNKVSAQEFAEKRYEFHKRLQEDFFAVYRVGPLQPYQVQRGDNYWGLCREKFGIPMWLLKHCNPEVDLSQLTLQQTLMIPTIEKTTGDEPGLGAPDETEEDPSGSDQIDTELEKNESSQLPRQTS